MSMGSAAMAPAPSNRTGNVLALLPLLIVLFAAWRYDLAANIRGDYRGLVGALLIVFGALAGGAHIAAKRGWRHAALLPLLAACVPALGVVVFAGWTSAFATLWKTSATSNGWPACRGVRCGTSRSRPMPTASSSRAPPGSPCLPSCRR
jgi:hypothetical protein